MVLHRRTLILFPAAVLLGGCPPPPRPISSKLEDGRVVFTAQSKWFFNPGRCWSEVAVADAERLLWRVRLRAGAACSGQDRFSTPYGKAPAGFDVMTPPAGLDAGVTYLVVARDEPDPGLYAGAFRLGGGGAIESYGPHDPVTRGLYEAWRAELQEAATP